MSSVLNAIRVQLGLILKGLLVHMHVTIHVLAIKSLKQPGGGGGVIIPAGGVQLCPPPPLPPPGIKFSTLDINRLIVHF